MEHSADEPESVTALDLKLLQLLPYLSDLTVHRHPNAPLPQTVNCYGVVMFADISGFTALCGKYCSAAKSKSDGVDQLTTTLNLYLSKIVQSILNVGGDILKFAGDALLAFWPCSRFTASGSLSYIIQESLQMQVKYDNFETSNGDILRIKIGVSVGKAEIHYIGNDEYKTIDITGVAIDDVNQAQSECKSGAVVVSKAAWNMCDQQRCIATMTGQAGCAQVRKMVPEKEDLPSTSQFLPNKKDRIASASVFRSSKKRGSIEHYCRPAVRKVLSTMNSEAQQIMRHYVSKTVVHKVDHGQDVDWLSELREVCVLFINLDPGRPLDASQTLNLLQTSFDVIYPCLRTFEGTLNKVFMFDKGCTFLCIFGLPHAKHEDDTSRALRAARHIYQHLADLELKSYSIGVTTGIAFCGVVGHPQRHEYTVIGQKVNMAARLMMKFPNAVTCEETTRYKSTLLDSEFTLLPPVSLKGIAQPENVYTLCTKTTPTAHCQSNDVHLPTEYQNLIGRNREMAMFLEELMQVCEHTPRDPGVVILSGVGGMGKSKILRAMKAKAASMGFRIVSSKGGLVEKDTPLFTVKTLVMCLLELENVSNTQEREQRILQHVTDENMRLMLSLLNDILIVEFPQTHLTSPLTHEERTAERHKLFIHIVQQVVRNKPCVFGVDDVHWVDQDSWSFLLDLAFNSNSLLVMTTRPLAMEKLKQKPSAMQRILDHPHTKVIALSGLQMEDMYTLACCLLNVDSIPRSIQQVISERSHGVPLWVEELIKTMLEINYLEIINEAATSIIEEEGEEDNDILTPRAAAGRVLLRSETKRSNSVHLIQGRSITDIPIPDSVFGIVLSRIDHLSPPGQMSLKCAAVIGTVFNKSMLQAIVPNSNQASFQQSLDYLVEARMIECAISAHVRNMNSETEADCRVDCPCLSYSPPRCTVDNKRRRFSAPPLPINQCNLLQFTHTYLQETAYSLWTESQRKSLHQAAALFLESHKCVSCGGEGLLAIGLRGSIAVNITKTNEADAIKQTRSKENVDNPFGRTSKRASIGGGDGGNHVCLDKFDISKKACNCDVIMASVYPQLVRHWKCARDAPKTLHYILLAASVAVAANNNMEALSLLCEAKDITLVKFGKDSLSKPDTIRLESLIGLALFQSGAIDECQYHFETSLKLLETRLPSRAIPSAWFLGYHALKQYLHRKYPAKFPGSESVRDPQLFLDQSRCLTHLTHVYYLQRKKIRALMVAFKQLNAVEGAKRSIPELVEAYTTMIECCQLLNLKGLACSYLKTAMILCATAQLNAEGVLMHTHLLCVGTNLKLCLGVIDEALDTAYINHRLIRRMGLICVQLTSLPLLFFCLLSVFMVPECKDILKQLNEAAAEANDLRAQVLHDCCQFDALLEFGVGEEDVEKLVKEAKNCCEETVYTFKDTERYFLVSCLALWYARHDNRALAEIYQKLAKDLCPRKLDTYLAVRGLTRYIECLLVLHKQTPSQLPEEPMKKLKKLCKTFAVFKPRRLLFCAYISYRQKQFRKAKRFLSAAIAEATKRVCVFDCEWASACQISWFGSISNETDRDTNKHIAFILQ